MPFWRFLWISDLGKIESAPRWRSPNPTRGHCACYPRSGACWVPENFLSHQSRLSPPMRGLNVVKPTGHWKSKNRSTRKDDEDFSLWGHVFAHITGPCRTQDYFEGRCSIYATRDTPDPAIHAPSPERVDLPLFSQGSLTPITASRTTNHHLGPARASAIDVKCT